MLVPALIELTFRADHTAERVHGRLCVERIVTLFISFYGRIGTCAWLFVWSNSQRAAKSLGPFGETSAPDFSVTVDG